jgi:hypothetical protein
LIRIAQIDSRLIDNEKHWEFLFSFNTISELKEIKVWLKEERPDAYSWRNISIKNKSKDGTKLLRILSFPLKEDAALFKLFWAEYF